MSSSPQLPDAPGVIPDSFLLPLPGNLGVIDFALLEFNHRYQCFSFRKFFENRLLLIPNF